MNSDVDSVWVDVGNGASVGSEIGIQNLPSTVDASSLTWSVITDNTPFTVNNSGQLSVCGVLDTEYVQSAGATKGQYTFTVQATDGAGFTVSAVQTVNVTGTLALTGATIYVTGKSDKEVSATVGYYLEGGPPNSGGPPGVLAGHQFLLNDANGGDELIVGNDDPLQTYQWVISAVVPTLTTTPNSVECVELDPLVIGDIPRATAVYTDANVLKLVDNAEAVFICGGDQESYQQEWVGSQFQTHLQAKIGTIAIGGTSAGMHVLSETVYLGGSNVTEESFQDSFLTIPLFEDMIFDTHVWQRNRMGRAAAELAISGLADHLIAADALTGLTITPNGIATVVAAPAANMRFGGVASERAIYFLSGDSATNSTVGNAVNISNIETYRLVPGDQFDLNDWTPVVTTATMYYVSENGTVVTGEDPTTNMIVSPYGPLSVAFDYTTARQQALRAGNGAHGDDEDGTGSEDGNEDGDQ